MTRSRLLCLVWAAREASIWQTSQPGAHLNSGTSSTSPAPLVHLWYISGTFSTSLAPLLPQAHPQYILYISSNSSTSRVDSKQQASHLNFTPVHFSVCNISCTTSALGWSFCTLWRRTRASGARARTGESQKDHNDLQRSIIMIIITIMIISIICKRSMLAMIVRIPRRG